MRTLLLAAAGFFAVDLSAQGRIQRPMTFEDFAAVKNVGDPQVSPDGKWVLYSLRTRTWGATDDLGDQAAMVAEEPHDSPDAKTQDGEARWSPD